MQTVLIDTLSVTKHLLAQGFTEAQAEGVVHAIQEIDLSHLSTKADMLLLERKIEQSETKLERRIEQVEAKLENKIESVKAELFKWMVPLMLGQAGLIAALVKLL